MLVQITHFLVDAVFTFFVFLLLARFHFQWLRVPFHNPLGEFVLAATSWMVMPVRRFIPGLRGYDIPTLLLAWVLQALSWVIKIAIAGGSLRLAAIAAVSFVELVEYSIYMLLFALIGMVIVSWLQAASPHSRSPFAAPLGAMTRPFLRPFRRFIPPLGMIDLSPAVLMLLLIILLRFILPEAQKLAAGLG